MGGAPVRRRPRSGRAHPPDPRAKELVFSLAQMVVDPAAGKDLVLCTAPGYPVPERGARFAGAEALRLPLTRLRRLLAAARPDRRAHVGPRRDPVAQLPEQPDRCDRAARAAPGRRRTVPAPRRAPGIGRGVLRAVVRRGAAAQRAADRGARERPRDPYPLETFIDDRLPARVRGRRPRADRCPATAPPGGRGDAAGVRPTGLDRRVERRDARGGDRAVYGADAECSSTCSPNSGWGSRRGGQRRSTCGSGSRASAVARCSPTISWNGPASWWRRAPSSDPRARGTCGWRWCRRRRRASERSSCSDAIGEVAA